MKKSIEDRIAERWNISAAQTRPENRIGADGIAAQLKALHDHHREACIHDVEAVLRETIIEFVIGHHAVTIGDGPRIGRSALWPDHAYYFGRSLYDLRFKEFQTGTPDLADIRDYFPALPLQDLPHYRDPALAREFVQDRQCAHAFCERDLKLIRAVHTATPVRPAGEIVAAGTHQVLSVLTHAPQDSMRPFLGLNAKAMAEYLVHTPEKAGFVEQGLRKKAETFVDTMPQIRNPGQFIQKINDLDATLQKRRKADKKNHNPDDNGPVTPLRG